jgi:hypothetical protein
MEPSKTAEVFETSTSRYWFENNLLFVIGKQGPQPPLEEQKKLTEDFIKKLNGKKICAVMDVTHSSAAPRESREYTSKMMPQMFTAIAFIAKNPVGRMLANLYFSFNPFPFEHKVFSNDEDALKWIRRFV